MSEHWRLTIAQARERLRNKELTSTELTQSVLERIRAVDGQVDAFLLVTEEWALARAKDYDKGRIDASLPLAGIPLALKDIFCTEGVPTTCASKILEGFKPPYSATVVEKLLDAGAVIVGKTNMDEFAMGSSCENSGYKPSRNPWDPERVPGGSSGGSAAAMAAGECLGALGTDTGGSIRQPAGLCGIVGMKPTYGRVSRYGVIAFASSLDQVGPMTRDVRDNAILLGAIAGHDPKDSTSIPQPVPDYEAALEGGFGGMRIGVPAEFRGKAEAAMNEAYEAALTKMKDAGAEIVEIDLPHTDLGIATYYIIAPAEASSNLARYDGVRYGHRAEIDLAKGEGLREMFKRTRSEGFGAEVKRRIMIGAYVLSAGYYDAYYRQAQRVRTLIRNDFTAAFEKVDVIATPTTPGPAFGIGEKVDDPVAMYMSDVFTVTIPIAGLPALSLPCGTTQGPNGELPLGLQFVGNHLEEERILRAAYAWEQVQGTGPLYPEL